MKINILDFIVILLMGSPIIDNVNGYLLLRGYSAYISSLYKFVLISVVIFAIIKGSKLEIRKKTMGIFLLVFFFLIFQLIIHELMDSTSFVGNLSHLIRIMYPIVIYGYLKNSLAEDTYNVICKVVTFYCWFYPLSLLVPQLLDIGFSTYGAYEFGSKGFYYAGNEISMIMIMIGMISFDRLLYNRSIIAAICCFINLIACVSIGTKSAYISVFILIVIYFVFDRGIVTKIKRFIFCLPVVIYLFYYIVSNTNYIHNLIDFWETKFRYNIRGNSYRYEYLTFWLSMRNIKLKEAFQSMSSNNDIAGFWFGRGYHFWVLEKNLLTEMDFFDVFLEYGIVVTIFLYWIIIKEVWCSCKNASIYMKVLCGLILSISTVAGHLLFSPSVSIVFVCVIVYIRGMTLYNK